MRGFTAWQEQYLQFARHKRMLAAAGARLTKPLVAAALSLWRGEWEKGQKRALLLNGRGELAVAHARILELEEQVPRPPSPSPNPSPSPSPSPNPNPNPNPNPKPNRCSTCSRRWTARCT